jgi:hypothetical protein
MASSISTERVHSSHNQLPQTAIRIPVVETGLIERDLDEAGFAVHYP